MNKTLMKCGCFAQGIDTKTNKPVCVLHFGLTPDAEEPMEKQIDLTNRRAKCIYCNSTKDSDLNLPFFVYHPEKEFDEFYNGCFGWD